MKINILWNRCHVFKNLVFHRPNESLSNNILSFTVCWIHFNVIYFQKIFKRIIIKFTTLVNPYFIWFSSFWDYFLKCVNNTNSFFVFYRNKPRILLNKSIAHNKYLFPLLSLLSGCISAKSTPQILSLKDE